MDFEQKINELKVQIEKLEKAIKETINKDNPFEFKDGEKYWHLEEDNNIDTGGREWSGEPWEIRLLRTGNIFKSIELAIREGLKRQLIQEIERWKWENYEKFVVYCDAKGTIRLENDILTAGKMNDYVDYLGEITFKSQEMAESALEHFGDRLKILFLPKYTI